MSKKLYAVLGVLVIASMLLAACAKATPAPTEAPAPVEPTEAPPPGRTAGAQDTRRSGD